MKTSPFLILAAAALFLAACATVSDPPPKAEVRAPAPAAAKAPVTPAASAPASVSARDRVLKEAEQYIDRPYKTPPNPPKSFDCSGYVKYIYDEVAGLELPSTSPAYAGVGAPVKFADAKPGDILIFSSVKGGTRIDHVAILFKKSKAGTLRGSWLIHAVSIPCGSSTILGKSSTSGVKITEMGKRADGNWQKEYFIQRFMAVRRVLPE
jgi:cell wall-associated NlpC family hydrolase